MGSILEKIKKHKISFNLLILVSFAILTVIDVLPLVLAKKAPEGADMQFHWQEIFDLVNTHQLFPHYALNSYLNSGSASLAMYPYLFLYPFALVFKITKSAVITNYLLFLVNIFTAFVISYYGSLMVNKNKLLSYVFSILYTITFPVILNSFGTYDISMNYSFAVMPLVLFGYLYLLKYNKWIILSIGMTILLYVSPIMSACTIPLLVIFTIINYKFFNKSKIIQLSKATITTVISSALFWLPALKIVLFNKLMNLSTPNIVGVNPITSLKTAVKSSLAVNVVGWKYDLTLFSALGALLGLVFFLHLSKLVRNCYIFSIIVLFITSDMFPWRYIHHSFLNNVQTPWRMYILAQVFLTYILAIYVTKLIKHSSKIKITHNHVIYALLLLLIMVLGFQFYNQRSIIHVAPSGKTNAAGLITIVRHNNKKNGQVVNGQLTNYYPSKSLSMYHYFLNSEGVHNNKPVHVENLGNGNFILNTSHKLSKVSLPFLYYHGTNYECTLNKNVIKSTPSSHQLLTIKNVPKGNNHIHINIKAGFTLIMSRILTIIGTLVYLWIFLKFIIDTKKPARN